MENHISFMCVLGGILFHETKLAYGYWMINLTIYLTQPSKNGSMELIPGKVATGTFLFTADYYYAFKCIGHYYSSVVWKTS